MRSNIRKLCAKQRGLFFQCLALFCTHIIPSPSLEPVQALEICFYGTRGSKMLPQQRKLTQGQASTSNAATEMYRMQSQNTEDVLDQCKLFKDTSFALLLPSGQKVALVAFGMTESKNAQLFLNSSSTGYYRSTYHSNIPHIAFSSSHAQAVTPNCVQNNKDIPTSLSQHLFPNTCC